MGRPRSLKPSYCLDKSSGRAYVVIDFRRTYLGKHGTQDSRDKYDRLIGEWIGRHRQPAAQPSQELRDAAARPPLASVVAAFWRHLLAYYATPSEKTNREHYRAALKILNRLYGNGLATTYGPVALRTTRDEMVKLGWSRRYVNSQVGRLRRMFKWAVAAEMIPPATWHALQAVEGLRRGKTPAPDPIPVGPVSDAQVAAVLPFLSRQVRGMVELQLATGMRPGEVCILRTIDVDQSAALWVYRPADHKTAHRGHVREVFLTQAAQQILSPFLRPDLPAAFVFSPADADRERHAKRAASRKTPAEQGNRPESNRVKNPKRKPGERYNPASYGHAVAQACNATFPPSPRLARAGRLGNRWRRTRKGRPVPKHLASVLDELRMWQAEHRWHPHQLRHAFATKVRKSHGLEVVQVLLGHRHARITEVYAERDREAAARAVSQM